MTIHQFAIGLLIWCTMLIAAYLGEHGYRSLGIAVLFPGLSIILGIPTIMFLVIQHVRQGRLREAALGMCFTAIAVGCLPPANGVLDIARLHLFRSYYEKNVNFSFALSAGDVRLRSWGDSGFAGTSTFYTLVYDETREILKPPDQRSEEWKRVVEPSLENMIITDARHNHHRLTGDYSVIASSL